MQHPSNRPFSAHPLVPSLYLPVECEIVTVSELTASEKLFRLAGHRSNSGLGLWPPLPLSSS